LNLFNAIVGSIGIFVSGHAQWRSFDRNGMERVKGRSYPKPLVRANPWGFGAQWSVMDQTTRLVDDKEVKKDHGDAVLWCECFFPSLWVFRMWLRSCELVYNSPPRVRA
jgi:hypothetical protein